MTSTKKISHLDENRNEMCKRLPVNPLFETFEECTEEVLTDISGVIPSWISGAVVRIGPGKFEFGEDKVKHWFDGHGIVHKFSIKNGEVSFQSRFLETDAYKSNTAQQRITMAEFGTAATPDPCASKFARFKAMFYNADRSDNVNVNVFKFGDTLLANTDSPLMQTVTTDLDIVNKVNLTNIVSLTIASSHPHFDRDGTMYIAGTSYKGRPTYHIVKVPPPKPGSVTDTCELLSQAQIVATIPARSPLSPSYSHSFGMTENYFIYCETPVTMNLFKTLSRVVRGTALNDVFNYDPNEMAVFHVVHKETGDVLPLKFQVRGLFFWHTINCYEEDEHIVMDLCSFSDFTNRDLFTQPLEEFRSGQWINEKKWANYKHHPLRLVLPLKLTSAGINSRHQNLVKLQKTDCKAFLKDNNLIELEPERLLPDGQDRIDMPEINYGLVNGRKYRYFYGTGLFVNQFFMNGLGKVDVLQKTSLRWKGTVDQYPSEPTFIPHPDGQAEDEGVVLSSVCDTDPAKRDFLLLLDGKTFKEIARAYVPDKVQVPYSFHGSYFKL